MATPSILRRRAFWHVDVDVALVKQGRLDAEGDRTRAHVRRRRRDRLLHHVAQIAGHRHATLAGHHAPTPQAALAKSPKPSTETTR